MSNKIICPECGGELQYWEENIADKTLNINPTTGRLGKVKTGALRPLDSMSGLKCSKCEWFINDSNFIPTEFEKWYDEHLDDIRMKLGWN